MTVIVIVGPHTAGKSTFIERLSGRGALTANFLDTDAAVSGDYASSIYNMFLALTNGDNTHQALNLIEMRERALLKELKFQNMPCLVAAGPLVPIREPEWSEFLATVNPICFYFKLSAKEMFAGLRRRRRKQQFSGLDQRENFGSWDKELGMRYDNENKRWAEITEAEAIPLIENFLARVTPSYEKSCERFRVYQAQNIKFDKQLREDLEETFHYYLSKSTVTSVPIKQSFSVEPFAPYPYARGSLRSLLAPACASISPDSIPALCTASIEWSL